MLVESSRPPIPVSRTTRSTPADWKADRAMVNMSSKKLGWSSSHTSMWSTTKATKASWGIHAPLIRMRSRGSFRWGEVYRPTVWPRA